ncbi:DUF4129 domain-containing protein, partial [Acinetobacter baumannii]
QRLLSSDPISQLAREQNRFQFAVEALVQHPRRFSQSITEFVSKHRDGLGEVFERAAELARAYETAFFSGEPVTVDQVAQMRAETTHVVK